MIALSLMIAANVADLGKMPAAPACRSGQLHMSLDGGDGEFNGMSHSGVEVSIKNGGGDCTLTALPIIELRDAHGRLLPAVRQAPIGMHPGPVMVPIRIVRGSRIATNLRWVSGPVFAANRTIRVANVVMTIGKQVLRAPLKAMMFGENGKPVQFEQPPFQAQLLDQS